MQNHVTTGLLKRLDAGNYSKGETFVLTFPLSLPYPVGEYDYKRVNGEFEFRGESYRLVKQKVENDTVFIVCLRDSESTKIAAAFNDFTKLSHNLPATNKKALNFLAKLYKDFKSTEFRMLYQSRMMYERVYIAFESFDPGSRDLPVDSPPPERAG